jgi:hypothetical protein
MVGEILGKKCVSIFVLVAVIVTLEHDTPFVIQSGLGNPSVSCLTFRKFISWVVFESMLPRPLSCRSYVQEKSKNHVLVYSIFFPFLENIDIDEFNKILGHCVYGNDKRFLLIVI